MEYDNTNSGALFRNTRRTSDRHPEYTGTVNVEGKEYWLSAWVKTRRGTNEKFFSMALTAKDAPNDGAMKGTVGNDAEDELPF